MNPVSTQETSTAPALWNPSALANWSLLLSPLWGSYLVAKNYAAMGAQKDAKKAMEWFYVGIAVLLSVFILSPFGWFGAAMLVYVVYLVLWNFMSARKQLRAVVAAYGKDYERQPWGKVLAVGVAALLAWQIIVQVALPTNTFQVSAVFDSAQVKQVKEGVLQLCPNHTVDQMVNGFMGSPSWESGKNNDGKVFVNVKGDITFSNKPVKAMVQFIVEGQNFSFRAFEMNGVPSANMIAVGLLNKMCESAHGTVTEKTGEKAAAAQPVEVTPANPPTTDASQPSQNTQTAIFSVPTEIPLPLKTRFGEITASAENVLLVNGKPLSPSIEGFPLEIIGLNDTGPRDVVLVRASTGGNGCAANYYFVSVSLSGASPSKQFGQCIEQLKTAKQGEEILVSIPSSDGNHIFSLSGNRILDNGKPLQ